MELATDSGTISSPDLRIGSTRMFRLTGGFARREKLPVWFVGTIVGETRKAWKVYGRGTLETRRTNQCCVCSRPLTHPVSVILGIGPECGDHWWNWDAIGGYNAENLERVKQYVEGVIIDQWLPKRAIIEDHATQEVIQVPSSVERTGKLERNRPPRKADDAIDSRGQRTYARRAELMGLYVRIFFEYSKEDVERVRMLEDRRFEPSVPKHWTCAFTTDNVERLDEWGFMLDQPLTDFLKFQREKKAAEPVNELVKFDPSVLRGTPYQFQIEGYEFTERHRGRVLIGDEMGLGKTIQAIMYIAMHVKLRPVVIVVPSVAKLNWARECVKWIRAKVKVAVIDGTSPYPIDPDTDIIVINYDVLPHWVEDLRALKPQIVIGDEIHYCKSNKAKRTKAMKMLVKGVRHVILMSGTPALNRPVELYNALRMIDRNLVPDWNEFVHTYCAAKRSRWGLDTSGASNLDDLREKILRKVMIRRLKRDVLKELPEQTFSVVPMEMTNSVEYAEALLEFQRWRDEMEYKRKMGDPSVRAEALVRIGKLRRICVRGKMPGIIEWIKDSLDANGKLIVFAVHTEVIDTIMDEFQSCAVKVDGSVTGTARQGAQDLFQENDRVKLFVGQIKAAGVNITLTAATKVAFIELPWTPGEVDQAAARPHRIGQKDAVNVYYLVASDTIDERMAELLDAKRKVLDKLVDGKDTDEESLLSELMASI